MKKRLLALLAAAAMMLSAGCSGKNNDSSQNSSPAAEQSAGSVKGFQVDGTELIDANGNPFVLRGINHAHTWFKDELGIALQAIANTKANAVRIVLSDGGQWQEDDVDSVKDIINRCKELKLVTILEVHDATGVNDISALEAAGDYWIKIKDALAGNEDCVILNVANEWTGDWDSNLWEKGYTTVIPKLRQAGIKNTIMVDAGGWGQYGRSIADGGKAVFESDPDRNTMFSVHMYGTAGKNEKTITDNLEGVTGQGLCVCVGEFGYNHSDGDVDEQFIMDYCTENNIGYMAWSWKGNGGGVEYLDLAVTWDGSQLSSDWGENLVNGKNGIKETSKVCSVFE